MTEPRRLFSVVKLAELLVFLDTGLGGAWISIISDELKILTRAYGLEPKLAPSLHPQEPDLTDCKLSILVRQQQKEIHADGFPCFCAEALKQTFLRVSSYFKILGI